MKPSSSEEGIRPLDLSRQLRRGGLEARYAEPKVEAALAAATKAAVDNARAEGYAAGWAQGRQAAAEREADDRQQRAAADAAHRRALEGRTASLMQALSTTARTAADARVPEWNQVADVLTEGALTIARAAISRELDSVDNPTAEAVRMAVRTLGRPSDLVIHVNPDDTDLLPETPGVRIEPDPAVPPGSIHARTPGQQLRWDLMDALMAADEAMRT